MDLRGEVTIQATPEEVWAFLIQPDQVGACVPGLENLEVVVPGEHFQVVASVGLGSVKARFNADVRWAELDPPHRARMLAKGTAPGNQLDASSEMILTPGPSGDTQLSWNARVMISGTLASLANRVMGSVAKRLSGAFFDCVKARVETGPQED
jgi:carbon monoxide dehydrogenase subunit G